MVQRQSRLSSASPQPQRAAAKEWPTSSLIEKAIPAAAVVIGLLLLAGPFLSTVLRSFIVAPEAGPPVFGLSNFLDLIKDQAFLEAATNTILSGAGATLFSGVFGFSLAWIVARTEIPGRSWFEVLNLVPFFCRRTSVP